MRNPLRLPKLLRDTVKAIEAWAPHAEEASNAKREILELTCELREADLSAKERAAILRRIDELRQRARSENEAAERPFQKLAADHPDWVDF